MGKKAAGAARRRTKGKAGAKSSSASGASGRESKGDAEAPPAEAPPAEAPPAEAGKQWYTVREAAEHLGVSQPTIFRWMKDGLLSFFKVGGSTRFSREGLDSLIEKTTGLKEAEAAAGRCAACGHSVLVEGRLQGTGRLYFKPDRTKFWVFADSMVGLTARVCSACGFVQLSADVSKLKKLKPEDAGR